MAHAQAARRGRRNNKSTNAAGLPLRNQWEINMQVHRGFSVHRVDDTRSDRSAWIQGGRGREGFQNPDLQSEKETGACALPRDIDLRDRTVALSLHEVVLAVARQGNVSSIDLVSACREQDLVVWRLVLYGLCRELTYASYAKIGRILGNRDHSTIMKGLKRLKELRAKDPAIDAAYINLSQQLSQS